eukprot:354234-Chlamydomonas_euryale.AAC.16
MKGRPSHYEQCIRYHIARVFDYRPQSCRMRVQPLPTASAMLTRRIQHRCDLRSRGVMPRLRPPGARGGGGCM